MDDVSIKAKKYSHLFIWAGILLVFILLTTTYIRFREPIATNVEKAQQSANRAEQVFSTSGVKGNVSADLTLIEFGDFQCPFCKDLQSVLSEILEERENLQLVWIHRINSEHPQSESAAVAAECARQQGAFWEFHDYLFDNQTDLSTLLYNQIAEQIGLKKDLFQECLGSSAAKSTVYLHNTFAQENEVTSTPTLIIGTEHLEGVVSKEEILAAIDRQS